MRVAAVIRLLIIIFNADLNLQILSMADKYSALREKRVYKEPMSKKERAISECSDDHL